MLDIIAIAVFTVLINIVGTLSPVVRLAGIRTGKIAVSYSIFNILVLVSRSAHALQAPLLARYIERTIDMGPGDATACIFRIILAAAAVGTLAGLSLVPTFLNMMTALVHRFDMNRSVPQTLMHGFSKAGVIGMKQALRPPRKSDIEQMGEIKRLPKRLILINTTATSLLATGALSAMYAGYFVPELRLTAHALSPLIIGMATVMLAIFIDPFFSILTDDVLLGRQPVKRFRKYLLVLLFSRLAGIMAAQLLFLPGARLIGWMVGKIH